jgi:predicted peptidase
MDFPAAPGLHDVETRMADGRTVRYSLSVPASAPDAQRRPLVLVLHYAGTPTRFYGRPLLEFLFGPALAPLGAVFIAPESLRGQWHTEENEAFVMHLLDGAASAYDIDPTRVVVGGYSMGAIGTWHFIAHYPERFSAALPVAGYPHGVFDCPRPVHAFHSASDELFPLALLQERVTALAAQGQPITLTTAEVNGHYDVNAYRTALGEAPAWLAGIWKTQAG